MHEIKSTSRVSDLGQNSERTGVAMCSPLHATLVTQIKERAKSASSVLGRRHFETKRQELNSADFLRVVKFNLKACSKSGSDSQAKYSKVPHSVGSSKVHLHLHGDCPVPLLKLRHVQTLRAPLLQSTGNIYLEASGKSQSARKYSRSIRRKDSIEIDKRYSYDNCLTVMSFVKGQGRNAFSSQSCRPMDFDYRCNSAPPGNAVEQSMSSFDAYKERKSFPLHHRYRQQSALIRSLGSSITSGACKEDHVTELQPLIPTRLATRRSARSVSSGQGCFQACLASDSHVKGDEH